MNYRNGFIRRRLVGEHLCAEAHTVSEDHPQHWHNYFEIEMILSGGGSYVINDIAYKIEPGAVFLLTPTDFHYLKITDETKLINISFDEHVADEAYLSELFLAENTSAHLLGGEQLSRIVSAAELLIHECAIGGECREELLRYVLSHLLHKNGRRKIDGEHSRGIKRAIIYMALHFREQIRLADIAAAAGYNPSYFSRLFKKATGEGYTEHLLKLRIGHSKMLLSAGHSVTDAGALSGFASRTAFLDSFRRTVGVCPSKYKSRAAKQPAEHDIFAAKEI